MQKLLLLFLILPSFVQSQRLINAFPDIKYRIICPYDDSTKEKIRQENIHYEVFYTDSIWRNKIKDTSKPTYYEFGKPVCLNGTADSGEIFYPINKLNDSIKRWVFYSKKYNNIQGTETLVKKMYRKEKPYLLEFRPENEQNGLFFVVIEIYSSKKERRYPLYIHYDLKTGNFFTLQDMLKTKNDIFSYQQSVYSTMADSIRYFEQTTVNQLLDNGKIDKEKYGVIIEKLNTDLSVFRANYLSDFIITDKGIEEDFDCILPNELLPYNHTYKIMFDYKTLKNLVKQDYLGRLMK